MRKIASDLALVRDTHPGRAGLGRAGSGDFAILVDVDDFGSELGATLAFWRISFRNPCRRLRISVGNEHHARILETRCVQRSHSGGLGNAILVDVTQFSKRWGGGPAGPGRAGPGRAISKSL